MPCLRTDRTRKNPRRDVTRLTLEMWRKERRSTSWPIRSLVGISSTSGTDLATRTCSRQLNSRRDLRHWRIIWVRSMSTAHKLSGDRHTNLFRNSTINKGEGGRSLKTVVPTNTSTGGSHRPPVLNEIWEILFRFCFVCGAWNSGGKQQEVNARLLATWNPS